MPFGGYFDGYYSNVLKPAITNVGLGALRADEIYGTGVVIEDVYEAIVSASICIADVTGRNPNVSYELGMTHAEKKPVLIITQDIDDVPFDYRHLRIIQYDPRQYGWEAPFQDAVIKTITEVQRDPVAHSALKPRSVEFDKAKKHLTEIFLYQSYDLNRKNEIFCDSSGNALIKTTWKVVARSPIFHLCHNIVCDNPGDVEIRRVYDVINARDLEYIVVSESQNHMSYFFIFGQFKNVGQHFKVETEVFAQNFFDIEKFLSDREMMMSTQAVTHGIRFAERADFIYLPKEEKFSGVYAQYLSHPKHKKVGAIISPVETNSHYLLKIVYDNDDPYQQETGAMVGLPENG